MKFLGLDGEFVDSRNGRRVTVKTGDVSSRTFVQGAVLGIVIPLALARQEGWSYLAMIGAGLAIFAVCVLKDLLRPVHIYH